MHMYVCMSCVLEEKTVCIVHPPTPRAPVWVSGVSCRGYRDSYQGKKGIAMVTEVVAMVTEPNLMWSSLTSLCMYVCM